MPEIRTIRPVFLAILLASLLVKSSVLAFGFAGTVAPDPGPLQPLDDVVWTGSGDGTRWADAANWSTGTVPGVNDHAIIDKNGDYEVTWNTNGVNASVGQITLGGTSGTQRLNFSFGTRIVDSGIAVGSNGYLVMQAGITTATPIQIDGQLEWLSGTLTADLTNDGTITLPGGSQTLDGALVNNGSFIATNAWFRPGDNATLLNAGTMELIYTTPSFFSPLSPGNGSVFTNTGTLIKSGADHFRMFIPSVMDGTVDVQEGRLDFEGGVEFIEGVSLSTAPGASTEVSNNGFQQSGGILKLPPTLSHSGGGIFLIHLPFLINEASIVVDPAGTTINSTAPGITWSSGVLNGGTLTNAGYVNLVQSQEIRGGGTFINDGVVTGGSSGFTLNEASTFRNNGEMLLSSFVRLQARDGEGTFVNSDGALFSAPAGASISSSGGILTLDLQGTMAWNGTIDLHNLESIVKNAAKWEVAGADSIGSIAWYSRFEMDAEAELVIDVTTEGRDVFNDWLGANFAGTLTVRVAESRQLVDGERFSIAGGVVEAAFTNRESLTVEAQDKSLYQELDRGLYWLTVYDGIQTLTDQIAVEPFEGITGDQVLLEVSGEGLSPDMTATLECDGCADPIGSATIAGRFRAVTPIDASIMFDLADGDDVFGSYKLVLTDPRGGRAETPFLVIEAAPTITIDAVDSEASEANRDRGLILVSTNQPVRTPLNFPYSLSGTAKQYQDFLTDVQGEFIQIPEGEDSVYVSIIPLNDTDVESSETVILSADYSGPIEGSRSATVNISDGPGSNDAALFGFSPRNGGSSGVVTLLIYGEGLSNDNTVTLTGVGDPIIGRAQEVNETGTVLTSSFLFADEPPGERVVRVATGSDELVADEGFRVETVTYPDVFVQVFAPPAVRLLRRVPYTILLRNRGNIDVSGYVALAGSAIDDSWELVDDPVDDVDGFESWNELFPSYENSDGWTIINLPEVTLLAGETRRLRLSVTGLNTHDVLASWTYLQ